MMRSKPARTSQRHLHVATSKAWRDVDETRPLLPAPPAARWSALIVEPRMEAKAATALREAGHIVWYPQTVETVARQHLRLRIKVNRPLFPRYVFAAAGRARKGMLDCDHVVRIVGVVGPALMAELSRRQAGGEFVTELRQSLYRRGARVRIIDGPFQGLDGIVHRGEAERIDVLVGMLGQQVSVRIDTDQVRAA